MSGVNMRERTDAYEFLKCRRAILANFCEPKIQRVRQITTLAQWTIVPYHIVCLIELLAPGLSIIDETLLFIHVRVKRPHQYQKYIQPLSRIKSIFHRRVCRANNYEWWQRTRIARRWKKLNQVAYIILYRQRERKEEPAPLNICASVGHSLIQPDPDFIKRRIYTSDDEGE